MQISDLQHGDLIFVRDNNLLSALIRNTQGDFDWSHVCSFWLIDGKPTILTTGARWNWRKMAFVFGAVPAEEYLSTRIWTVGRRIDLIPAMQEHRLACLLRHVERETPYAVAKVLKLAAKGRLSAGVVNQIHREPEVYPVKVFCAEAEAQGIIEGKQAFMDRSLALETVNRKYRHKLEACVHTPETLYDSPDTLNF